MMRKNIIIAGISAISAFSSWTVALAADGRPPIIPTGSGEKEPLLLPQSPSGVAEEQYFGGYYLPAITKVVIAAAGISAVLFIIIGGIQILTAYGNDEKIGKAKKTITYAIIGLLIAILSYAIVSTISVINL